MGADSRRLIGVVSFLYLLLSCNTVFAGCAKWVAKIASVQGSVESKQLNSNSWQPVKLNDTLCPGDQIRVNRNSRAAIVLVNETLLRLDQNSAIKLTAIKPKQASVLELLKGIGHFISRVPRSLKVETPTLNAAIEGTEFVLAVGAKETRLTVFEGKVLASNRLGQIHVTSGESAVGGTASAPHKSLLAKPRDAVQWAVYYPPILDPALKPADPIYHAAALLNTGQVTEANKILSKYPDDGHSLALQAIIAIMQNHNQQALQQAQRATLLAPASAAPYIALSYAWQANLDLDTALASAQDAVSKEPANALAWARLAELQLSVGERDDALRSAQKAAGLDNKLSRTQTVLGFAHLLQIDIDAASRAFQQAIQRDQTDPLPRLGLGLAKIRRNDLVAGRREIEIAASLDPNNSLIRSYLGKAYFEEKRSPLDTDQFVMAKQLDRYDPTPWFYDAIAKQAENRPVEALESLQKSIDLNGNRAVYRSSLQLDQDNAARSASQARIYNNLGFQQLALQQAYTSLYQDPGNYSVHRLLADTYATMPRHEIARVSELLQAQLLQPVSNIALQPHLAESTLATSNNLGPAQLSLNEFNPLFVRDGLTLQMNGVQGSNNTYGGDAVVSGIANKFAFSLGYYNFNTDGFRDNNDLEEDVYNALVQYDFSPDFSIQVEKRRHKNEHGDIEMNFDPTDFSTTDRRKLQQDTDRVGIHYKPTANSNLLLSYIQSDRTTSQQLLDQTPAVSESITLESEQSEIQYQYQLSWLNLIGGLSQYNVNQDKYSEYDWTDLFGSKCPSGIGVPCDAQSDFTRKHKSGYVYSNFSLFRDLHWTLGVSYDDLDDRDLHINEFNPKMGLQIDFAGRAQLRLAYLKTVKKTLLAQQSLEPTQVAGFNQLYDDINGTKAKQHGIGIDAKLTSRLASGLEFTRRDLEIPEFLSDNTVNIENRRDDMYRFYLDWLPAARWSLGAEYQLSKIDNTTGTGPTSLDSTRLPVTLRYHHPVGFYSSLGITPVKQQVELPSSSTYTRTEESFTLVDLAVGYRFAKRRGTIRLEINNVFDKKFIYQDLNFTRSEDINPRYIPERTVMGRLSLSF